MLAKLKSSRIGKPSFQIEVEGMNVQTSLQEFQTKLQTSPQIVIAASMFSSPHSRVSMDFSLVSFDNFVIVPVASQKLNWSSPASEFD